MINYEMKYGVSETASLFHVERSTIHSWTFHFAKYLSPEANPTKGNVRHFTIDDLRVLAYVSLHWEENPDIEYIYYSLNSGSHYETSIIDDFIQKTTPLFRTMPENIDETWRGVVFGGEFGLGSLFTNADAFKLSGDRLIDIAIENYEEKEVFQPALYNYRHAVELYIKAIVGEEKEHQLNKLLDKLKKVLSAKYDIDIPEWFTNIINAYAEIDPKSTTFRYSDSPPSDELYADMQHIKSIMNELSIFIRNIYKIDNIV